MDHEFSTSRIVFDGGYGNRMADRIKRGPGRPVQSADTESLAPGQSVEAHSSPKNSGTAIEMEIFEWRSASAGGNYRCNIVSNKAGTTLTIRLIGVSATPLGSCDALPGGSCSTPTIGLLGEFKFLCIVATSNNGQAS